MEDMQEILRRTNLQMLAEYLLNIPQMLEQLPAEEFSEGSMLRCAQSDLDVAMNKAGVQGDRGIIEAAEAMAQVERKAGFLKGMRAGARLVLKLLGEEEEIR